MSDHEESIMKMVTEISSRMTQIEHEITRLKTLLAAGLSPPGQLTQFGETIDLSLRETEPFFREITRLMREELEGKEARGIVIVAGLYENPESDQRAWWASRHTVEGLLSAGDQLIEKASQLAKSLSSPVRLRMLTDLCYGPRRFRELIATTGVKGGQLTHHLQPIIAQGLVEKKQDSYALTTKGWKVLLALFLTAQPVDSS